MSTSQITDLEGQAAFEKYERLLARARVDSRLVGAELAAAKKEYLAFLPELQPIGQAMLDRAIETLRTIESRLKVPHGYHVRSNLDRPSCETKFVAGKFQLNSDFSFYIDKIGGATDDSFGAEVRVFTHKVHAFVPCHVGHGYVTGNKIYPFGSNSFVSADSYAELSDKVVSALQAVIDKHAAAEPAAAPAKKHGRPGF